MEKRKSKKQKSAKISRLHKIRFSARIEDQKAAALPVSQQLEEAPRSLQRFFSAFGNTEWGSSLGAKDVLEVLTGGGQLSKRALSELSSVRMVSAHGKELSVNAVIVDVKSNEDARLFENILDALGPDYLRSVALDYEVLRTFGVNRLEDRCSGVHTLIITDTLSEFDLSKLLQHCGTNLKKLDLQGNRLRNSHINAIEKFCSNLNDLRIAYNDWNPEAFSWETIGYTLEVLTITCPVDFLKNRSTQSETLTAIIRYCTKLSGVEIEYPSYEDFSFPVAFCTLLGERLRSFKLTTSGTFMKKNDVRKIFEACPNATIDSHFWQDKRLFRLEKSSSLPTIFLFTELGKY